ncbi:MFS transporter [Galenea microaerophila]
MTVKQKNHFIFSRAFFPFFWVQFLGALNDNVFKNALVMMVMFQLGLTVSEATQWVTAAAGIFILPFFLFSNQAGYWADHWDKVKMVRWIKLAEIGIMLLGAGALWSQSVPLMMIVLFLMGTQSAFFGPIKYALLPEYLPEKDLDAANAMFSGSTFVAILLGTIAAGILVAQSSSFQQSLIWVSTTTLGLAGLGFLATFWLPKEPLHPCLHKKAQKRSLIQLIQQARQFKAAFRAVWAISWFWVIGAVFLSQVPVLAKQLHAQTHPLWLQVSPETLTTVMLSCFTLGIGLGAAGIVRHLQKQNGRVSVGWMGIGLALSMALFAICLYGLLRPLEGFLLLLMMIAGFGGAFVVPFYRIMQCETPAHFRASMVATNNIVNAGLMVTSAILVMIAYTIGLQLTEILLLLSGMTLLVVWQLLKGVNKIKNK